MSRFGWLHVKTCILVTFVLCTGACTTPREYLRNGFKVGPSYGVPQGCTAAQWIEETDQRVQPGCADLGYWWAVFQDPTLDGLIAEASSQNLSLREAGFRVLEARSQLRITAGNLFPQTQDAFATYQRSSFSQVANESAAALNQYFDQWALGFNLSWELDFWGRFRRAVVAAENTLAASAAEYDQVLVTLLGDVASNYVQICTVRQRLEYLHSNIDLQERMLQIATRRLEAGDTDALDTYQARSNLAQIQAQIPQLRLAMRQSSNRLSVLLGRPPVELEAELAIRGIPTAPPTVTIGIPADLLRRRPDVRRAERQAAAQGEEIGIAEADLYPMFAINGTLGYYAENVNQLVTPKAFTSTIGPVLQWNILNYGRIRHNIRAQDSRFWALVTAYQETVLRANAEVEDGLAMFLRAQERAYSLDQSVASTQQAVQLVSREYQGGAADFNRVALIQQNLVEQQDLLAQAQGEIALGLIHVYRALGGGWEVYPLAADSVALVPQPQEAAAAPPTMQPE